MLTAIAALDPNRVIGRDGQLPWHLPEDLRLFKKLTFGHPVVMGRRTWDSLPRKPLAGRPNFIISRTLPPIPEVTVLPEPALLGPHLAGRDAFLIGGAGLYAALIPFCDFLILSHLHACHQGDTYFPDFAPLFEPVETIHTSPDFHTVRYRNRNPVPLPT